MSTDFVYCGPGWVPQKVNKQTQCYLPLGGLHKSESIRNLCENIFYGKTAAPQNSEENKALKEVAAEFLLKSVWLGITPVLDGRGDLVDWEVEGQGRQKYFNWAPSHTRSLRGRDTCADLNTDGRWETGSCSDGSHSIICQRPPCNPGTYGRNCSSACPHCGGGGRCHYKKGSCWEGCAPGYKGPGCRLPCPPLHFGVDCARVCSRHCAGSGACSAVNGSCDEGCAPGYLPPSCGPTDASPELQCSWNCSENCKGLKCHSVNCGECAEGCVPGYAGSKCLVPCEMGQYGPGCSRTCRGCASNDSNKHDAHECSPTTGRCLHTCLRGFSGEYCDQNGQPGQHCGSRDWTVFDVIFIVVSIVLLSMGLAFMSLFIEKMEREKSVEQLLAARIDTRGSMTRDPSPDLEVDHVSDNSEWIGCEVDP